MRLKWLAITGLMIAGLLCESMAEDLNLKLKWQYETGNDVDSSPAVCDIDNDGRYEVLFGSYDSYLYCLSSTGELKWRYKTNNWIGSSPAVCDIDSDGRYEVLFGSNDSYLYCLSSTGELKWRYKTGNYVRSCPAVCDMDSDGRYEVLVGSWDYYLYCLSSTGELKWRYKTGGSVYSSPAVCDIDSDGRYEVLVSSWDSYLYCLSSTGELKWRYKTGLSLFLFSFSSPAVCDIDSNSKYEVLVGSRDCYLYCLSSRGELKWRYKTGRGVFSSPAVCDIDSDGRYEVLVGSSDCYLYCLSSTGELKWRYKTGDVVSSSPAVCDIDSDGRYEVLVGSRDNYLYCLEGKGAGEVAWACFRGNPQHTGYYEDAKRYAKEITKKAIEDAKRYAKEMTEKAIAFAKPKYPPMLSISAVFIDTNNNNRLDAEEKGLIKIVITNTGKGEGKNLKLILKPLTDAAGLQFEKEMIIKGIAVNGEKTIEIPITAEELITAKQIKLRIELFEPFYQADADPIVLSFYTKELIPPELIVHDFGIDDDRQGESLGNDNGKIELGELIEVDVVVQNKGEGLAENVVIEPQIKTEGVVYQSEKKNFNLGNLAAQEWKKISFAIFVGKRISADKINISLNIKESRDRFSKYASLALPLNIAIKGPEEVVVKPIEDKVSRPVAPSPPELTVDVDVKIPEGSVMHPDAIGVVIGVKDYEDKSIPDVEYALRDASIFKEYLIKTFGLREGNIIFLDNPTKAKFEEVFGTEKNYKGKLHNWTKAGKSDIFIYYSGHGVPDVEENKTYFLPKDATLEYAKLYGYPLDLFFNNLGKIPAKSKTVILDACFSGTSYKGQLIKKTSAIAIVPNSPELKEGITIITASQRLQLAHWYEEKRHGVFTYFLLKGISGAADKNKDKKITLSEIREYLERDLGYFVRRQFGREQTPEFSGDLDNVLVRLR